MTREAERWVVEPIVLHGNIISLAAYFCTWLKRQGRVTLEMLSPLLSLAVEEKGNEDRNLIEYKNPNAIFWENLKKKSLKQSANSQALRECSLADIFLPQLSDMQRNHPWLDDGYIPEKLVAMHVSLNMHHQHLNKCSSKQCSFILITHCIIVRLPIIIKPMSHSQWSPWKSPWNPMFNTAMWQ